MLRQWFEGLSAGTCLVLWDFKTDRWPPVPIPKPSPRPRAGFSHAAAMVWRAFGWHPVWFYGLSKLTDGPLSRSQSLPRAQELALAMLRQWFEGLSAGTCLVLWDFKTDRWPPVPIPKPSPRPRAGFSHAAAMVWWAFGWHPVWFYGISKLTDGPLSRSQSLPRAQELALAMLRQWFEGLSAGTCLVLWDFKTDRWPPVPIPKPSPRPRAGFSHAAAMVWWAFGWHPVWFYGISKLTDGPLSGSQSLPRAQELALAMLRQWFEGLSAGTLSGFMGFQNWPMAPCPDPKAFPAPKSWL